MATRKIPANAILGNGLGWLFASVVFAATFGFLWMMASQDDHSPPTKDGIRTQQAELNLAVNAKSVAPSMDSDKDVSDLYIKAVEDYFSRMKDYKALRGDRARRVSAESDLQDFPGLVYILQAGRSSRPVVFGNKPQLIMYFPKYDPTDDEKKKLWGEGLQYLGESLVLLAARQDKNTASDFSKLCYEAGFSLGYKMAMERLTIRELTDGAGLMSMSVEGLTRWAKTRGDKQMQEAMEAVRKQLTDFTKVQVEPAWRIFEKLKPDAGDMILLSQEARERCWRIAAIMNLAKVRYGAPVYGDQRWATRLLRKMQKDADPVIREAAKFATDFPVEEYRQLGS